MAKILKFLLGYIKLDYDTTMKLWYIKLDYDAKMTLRYEKCNQLVNIQKSWLKSQKYD